MYIQRLVTISSTAIIATLTASPLRSPGPSDTPIFSVVNPPSTSSPAVPTAAVRFISLAFTTTVTATAAVTGRLADNSSPYPAFNASNYPHRNSTKHHHHHHRNSTDMVPVMNSNCTNAMPETHTGGNQTSSGTAHTSEDTSKGHGERNTTGNAYGRKQETKSPQNSTQLRYNDPSSSPASRNPSVPYVSADGKVVESTPSTNNNQNQESSQRKDNLAGQDNSSAIKANRDTGDVRIKELVPAYVKALEKGPVI